MSTQQPTSPEICVENINIPYVVWSSPGVVADSPAPLLLVHDGPEYDERSGLTAFLEYQVQKGAVPPHRVALIEPVLGHRNEWYGASSEYNRSLANVLLPSVVESYPTNPRIVGMGASLGAVSMLGIAYENPRLFSGLFLQSGSFHHPNLDANPGGYGEYSRVASLVTSIIKSKHTDPTMRVSLTCGQKEANLTGNIAIFAALKSQNHDAELHTNDDGHDFESWAKQFDPHLVRLLQRAWE